MPKPRLDKFAKPKNLGAAVKSFARSLRPWRGALIGASLLATMSAVCSLFGPNILGQMTNTAVENYQAAAVAAKMRGEALSPELLASALDWGKLGGLAWTLLALFVASFALNYLQGALLSVVSARYAKKLRTQIIEKIAHLPIAYFDQHQIGDTLARMSSDVDAVATTLTTILSQLIFSVATLIGIFVMMLTISPLLSLIALVTVPLSLVCIGLVAKKAQTHYRANRKFFAEFYELVEEDYAGQSLIKANNHAAASIKKASELNQTVTVELRKANFFSQLAFPITNMFANFGYVAICIAGGRMAIDGRLLIGDIQAFLQYTNQFNRPITELSQIVSSIQQTLAASERIFDFLATPEEAPDPAPALEIAEIEGAVEFHEVNFSYDDTPTIQNFSAKIKPGMQVAIVGPTGAGKTTIINLLMRFYDPVSGYIAIDDTPTREMKRADVRKLFGMVLQDTWLFSGTIADNLKYGKPDATRAEIIKAAKAANVHHFIESLPHGYDTEISEDSDNISAGEKQLLTIARAMIANPPMMILDEATSNVDTRTERLIQAAFTKLTRGRTSFVIAHRLSTIREADLILVMREGKIVEQGTHAELLAQNGFYAELYNSQFAE